MSKNLLKKQIDDIQQQYHELLVELVPMFEKEECLRAAMDSISVFWRRNKKTISTYFEYVVKNNNTVFYSAATFFDVKNGEQYPFLLFGDIHIFDDPLGQYCELCCTKAAPVVFDEKVKQCAIDNIELYENSDGLVLILPVRYMWSDDDRNELFKIGEKFFLDFFYNINNIEDYYEKCDSLERINDEFKKEYQGVVCLYEGDSTEEAFVSRIEKACDMMREIVGESIDIGELFLLSLLGPINQAIDILLVTKTYNMIPLLRYPVALHNYFMLFPNFKMNDNNILLRIRVFNMLYRLFDQTKYQQIPLNEFKDKVIKFDFENKAVNSYFESDMNKTILQLHELVERFESFVLCDDED